MAEAEAAKETENETEMMLVRIRPERRAKAPKIRRYMFEGQRYDADRGWYEVTPETAEQLRKLNQDHYDPDSPRVFDVATKDEAVKIEEREAARAERATAIRPHAMSALEKRRAERRGAGGAFTTRDIARVSAAKHDKAEADEDFLDPDENADVDDLNEQPTGASRNVGRVRRPGATPGTEPVPPDESHDGDKGVHAYQNKAGPSESSKLGSTEEPLDRVEETAQADDEAAVGVRRRRK